MVENEKRDENEEDEPEPFGGEEALELARQGKDAWNKWAEGNPGRAVDFLGVDFTIEENEEISFEGFTFSGGVDFSWATFGEGFSVIKFEGTTFNGETLFFHTNFDGFANFKGAFFKEETDFSEAIFEKTAWFDGTTFVESINIVDATFKKSAAFTDATFNNYVNFQGTVFEGTVELNVRKFRIVPDLRHTEFQKHISLHGINVDFRRPTGPIDADMYRRLKELAVAARDHDREQMFFAYELMAKRGHETHGLKLIPNYLYEILSNFGRSLTLPCFWLISVWFMFGIFYRWLETAKPINHIWDGLIFSAAQLFPFLGASQGALGDARKALYGNEALSVGVNALAMIEGGLGLLFLFLIGLALRNRFRI